MSMASLSMMVGHQKCAFSIVRGVELSYRSQNENDESIRTPEEAQSIKWFPKRRWPRSERIIYDLRIPEMADDFTFLLRPHRDHFATIIKGVCASEPVRLRWVRPGESDGFRSAV